MVEDQNVTEQDQIEERTGPKWGRILAWGIVPTQDAEDVDRETAERALELVGRRRVRGAAIGVVVVRGFGHSRGSSSPSENGG